MSKHYIDHIQQNFPFPQEGFDLAEGYLNFNGVSIIDLIEKYGTPFKLTYLPKITSQIQKAKILFGQAMKEVNYQGQYQYCYCTKSNHFKFVLEEVLKNDVHIESSSSFDLALIRKLYENKLLDKNTFLLNNGFKTKAYIQEIARLVQDGFENVISILDNEEELDLLNNTISQEFKIGIRVATEETNDFKFKTSRFGVPSKKVLSFYKKKIHNNEYAKLKMLHFFVEEGIKDEKQYWKQLKKIVQLYCQLKKLCPDLFALNIGGGLPIRNSLDFDFDYQIVIHKIVRLIKETCIKQNIPEPDIFTEFGKYTVGESSAIIFSVIGQKQQNKWESWYIIDNSLMNTLPDIWGIDEQFILLPINKWNNNFKPANIGGLSCDNGDCYSYKKNNNIFSLPIISAKEKEPLYIGFFHTGAYQDALSGFGGINHCLISTPKHIVIKKDKNGNLIEQEVFSKQTAQEVLGILGFSS